MSARARCTPRVHLQGLNSAIRLSTKSSGQPIGLFLGVSEVAELFL